MARGNDPEAAEEFRKQYGAEGNAEQLIMANRARFSPELLAASRKPVDDEATKALDLDDLSKKVGEEVVSATVRGDSIVYAYVQDNDHVKAVMPREDYKDTGPKEKHTAGGPKTREARQTTAKSTRKKAAAKS